MAEQTTHQLVDIQEIKDGVVVLKNKNIRSVLMVSSTNFDLKSSDEKAALIASFQRLLNSLNFSIQIVIQSRPLELSEYFNFLEEKKGKQENELLRIQTTEYIDFVKELVKLSNIMSKFFYVVIPYDIAVSKKSGFLEKILPSKKDRGGKSGVRGMAEAIEKLELRKNQLISLLGSTGLRAIPLGDRELLELFYSLYNPGVVLKQKNFEALLATGDKAKQVE